MPDYERGEIRFGQSPDNAVYFSALLREYLQHRSEERLLRSYELLEKMKQLPTTLDPTVVLPAVIPATDAGAEVALTVDFRGTQSMPGSARIV